MIILYSMILEIIIRCFLGILICWFLYRTSILWFGFSTKKELKAGNKAIAFFWAGMLIMIGFIMAFVEK